MVRRRRQPGAISLERMEDLGPLLASGRPVLVEIAQPGCAPCQVMDGIMNELAAEYAETAHLVKVDVTRVAGAAQIWNVRSTPTMLLLGGVPPVAQRRKSRGERGAGYALRPRWQATGLVRKDHLERLLDGGAPSTPPAGKASSPLDAATAR